MNRLVRPFIPQDADSLPALTVLGITGRYIPPPAFTGVEEGRVVGSAGLVDLGLGRAEAWIVFAPDAPADLRWIAKAARRFLDREMASGSWRRIQSTVPSGDARLARWMLFLGMTRETLDGLPLHRYGLDGSDCDMWARWR